MRKSLGWFSLGALTCFAFAATGCGSSSTSLKYQFNENGCDTGEHSFSSQADYCAGLENSSLNNGCALDLRKAQFESSCSGTFAAS